MQINIHDCNNDYKEISTNIQFFNEKHENKISKKKKTKEEK